MIYHWIAEFKYDKIVYPNCVLKIFLFFKKFMILYSVIWSILELSPIYVGVGKDQIWMQQIPVSQIICIRSPNDFTAYIRSRFTLIPTTL